MYYKLNITENHLKVLSLFTRGYNKKYYIRQVQKILNVSPRTSQIILDDLEKKDVLESQLLGKIKLYSLKNNFTAKEYLKLVEQYKSLVFFKKNLLIKEIIENAEIKGIGIIFGSYAKNLQRKNSDLDIFIIGDYNQSIVPTGRNLGIKLNVKQYVKKIFTENIRSDHLIKEMIKDHIVFKGIEDFVDLVLENEKN